MCELQVEREKIELAKLKSQIKDLKLEKKAKKDDTKKGDDVASVNVDETASVDNAEILSQFNNEKSSDHVAGEPAVEDKSREVSQEVKAEDLVYEEPVRSPEKEMVDDAPPLVVEEVDVPVKPTEELLEPTEKNKETNMEEKTDQAVAEQVLEEEEEEEEDEEDDVSLLRMKSLIDGMMTRLEDRLTKTESALGDKLHKLDVDRDGVLDNDELKAAVMQLLRRHATSQDEDSSKEAADLIKLLDQDNDGRSM